MPNRYPIILVSKAEGEELKKLLIMKLKKFKREGLDQELEMLYEIIIDFEPVLQRMNIALQHYNLIAEEIEKVQGRAGTSTSTIEEENLILETFPVYHRGKGAENMNVEKARKLIVQEMATVTQKGNADFQIGDVQQFYYHLDRMEALTAILRALDEDSHDVQIDE